MSRAVGLRAITIATALTLIVAGAHAAAPTDGAPQEQSLPGSITPNYPPVPQPPEIDGKPFQDYLNSSDYLERLITYLVGYETWIGICTDAEPVNRVRTWMATEPVPLPGAERIDGPQWIEIVEIEGCQRTYQRMVYATVSDGNPVFHARLPGDSKAEPLLQHRAVTELREQQSEWSWTQGCDRVDRARILAGEVDKSWPGTTDTSWREEWVVHTCKGVKRVPVIFTPGADGEIIYSWDTE